MIPQYMDPGSLHFYLYICKLLNSFTLLFFNMSSIDSTLSSLEALLGYEFQDSDLLLRSIVTRSFLTDDPRFQHQDFHQNAFESLGDAVLDVLVIENAIHNDIHLSGAIDDLRQRNVRNQKLTEISHSINLQDYILWGKTQRSQRQWLTSNKLLANCLEAIFGAVFLDGGHEAVRKVAENLQLLEEISIETPSDSEEIILVRLKEEYPLSKLEELMNKIFSEGHSKAIKLNEDFYNLFLEKLVQHYNLPAIHFFNQVELKLRKFIKKNKSWILINTFY